MKKTFVATNPELGWDCVVGVYDAYNEQDVKDYLEDNGWDLSKGGDRIIIHQTETKILY